MVFFVHVYLWSMVLNNVSIAKLLWANSCESGYLLSLTQQQSTLSSSTVGDPDVFINELPCHLFKRPSSTPASRLIGPLEVNKALTRQRQLPVLTP